jgi:stearoyl-CoA desaturase (delta-9 desaturase)
MFVLTGAIALVAVPWYRLTHGFTAAAWWTAVLFAGRTAWRHHGLSPPVGTPHLRARWGIRLLLLVFGTMALQNSVFFWRRPRTHHLHVDDIDLDPYSARRGHSSRIGWMLREYPSGGRTSPTSRI